MILFYSMAAVAALIAYAVVTALGSPKRSMIALLVFLVPSVGLTASVLMVGDRIPPNAVTVEMDDAAASVPTDNQIALFQAEADKACLCTRHGGAAAHDRCWANYERLVGPFKPERMGTMCIGANYWDIFAGGKTSVTLQRAGDACTDKEEQAELAEMRREGLIEPEAADSGGCG